MKRKTIRVPEPPLLTITVYPAAFYPVSIVLENDYELTGEVHCNEGITVEQMWEVKQLLTNIVGALADSIWEEERKKPPFEPTGRLSPDGEKPSE